MAVVVIIVTIPVVVAVLIGIIIIDVIPIVVADGVFVCTITNRISVSRQ